MTFSNLKGLIILRKCDIKFGASYLKHMRRKLELAYIYIKDTRYLVDKIRYTFVSSYANEKVTHKDLVTWNMHNKNGNKEMTRK